MNREVAFLFAGWQPIVRILFVGTFAYLALLITLRISGLVDGDPILLYFDGGYAHRAMRAARIAESDVQEAVRAQGLSSLAVVEAVILEAGGAISIIRKSDHPLELLTRLKPEIPS